MKMIVLWEADKKTNLKKDKRGQRFTTLPKKAGQDSIDLNRKAGDMGEFLK